MTRGKSTNNDKVFSLLRVEDELGAIKGLVRCVILATTDATTDHSAANALQIVLYQVEDRLVSLASKIEAERMRNPAAVKEAA